MHGEPKSLGTGLEPVAWTPTCTQNAQETAFALGSSRVARARAAQGHVLSDPSCGRCSVGPRRQRPGALRYRSAPPRTAACRCAVAPGANRSALRAARWPDHASRRSAQPRQHQALFRGEGSGEPTAIERSMNATQTWGSDVPVRRSGPAPRGPRLPATRHSLSRLRRGPFWDWRARRPPAVDATRCRPPVE